MNYNVTTGKKLVIGYKYDAGGDSIVFTGYTKKEDESVVYLKFYNGENYLIPLVDMAVEIGSPLTDKTGVFPMQLVEILDGALIKNSPVWYGVVKNSLDQSTVTEVTTPELNLVYAQMYEAYQNILEIQETLVTAQNFDDMMAEYLEDHTIPVGVTSVNGLYGDVVLGAGQVGAIPAETVTQEDTTSSAAPGSQGTFEAVSEVYRNEYGQVIGVDMVTVTIPTIPAETSRTDTTSTARANVFSVIDEIETNEYGHVTAVNTKTVTVPSSGGGGGGTGAGEFVITVTKSGNTYTADRTGEDIQAAMEDGLVPILLEASNAVSGLAYHLSAYSQNLWVFDRPMSATKVAEFVLQGATPTITYTELTQTVDNALSSTSTNPVQNQAITTAISGLTADDIQDDSTVTTSGTVKDALRALSDEIANLEGGGAVPVSTVAQMSDTTKIYLYTGSETGYTAGHWYYYNGSAWVDGGEYGAVNSNVFSDYAKETLITILRSAMYTSDQSDNIDRLEDALARQVIAIGATIDLGGNTIYTDDELDTLRQYLTVTATYDDMTTSPVTGYALSGTLVAGTSTITITYQGNSTTVSVPVSQAVVRYAVTYNLTGVTSSNTDATIAEGNTYTTTLTAETAGYIPTEVVITMGGTDVTSTAYDASTHVVSIANVNGAISITAVEDEDPNAPVYELTSPLVLGDATDTRINLPDTCQVATGVAIPDDETWTLCVDFTSENGVATVNGVNVLVNDRNTKLYYGTPNWYIVWHNDSETIINDRVNNAWSGKNIVCVLTHEAGATVANLYGTVSGEINNTHTLANAGQIKLGSVTGAGTINKFAIYKRVLTASEIAEWTGA